MKLDEDAEQASKIENLTFWQPYRSLVLGYFLRLFAGLNEHQSDTNMHYVGTSALVEHAIASRVTNRLEERRRPCE